MKTITLSTPVDFLPSDFLKLPLTYDIKMSKRKYFTAAAMCSAQTVIGDITKGMRRFGLTAGQFSLNDLIEHILNQTGPADLYMTTWAASKEGIKRAFQFLHNSKVRKIRFMIDVGAKKVRDESFSDLLDSYGDSIRTTKIHAKFVIIRNEKWDIVIRTSANLNRNQRVENFEIDDDKEFADFLQSFFDEAFKIIVPEDNYNVKSSRKLEHVIVAMDPEGSKNMDNEIDLGFDTENIFNDIDFNF